MSKLKAALEWNKTLEELILEEQTISKKRNEEILARAVKMRKSKLSITNNRKTINDQG
ncbi:hypothetical protein J9317_18220 [Metabacillus sp. KIGAM252]|uniref:Uncharacterized protein n=1 Tax=Metabacillus flavus TaxID=2823519 RepID=A0ABS5LIW6_9BACI|nr:hypothetical protein [Metabacillus flavus]MBS2970682.1 hypothetical protein [Metabacillus flavus]